MRRAFLFASMIILVAGCKSEPPPPPEPEAPPPPTAEQIQADFKSATQRLWDAHYKNQGLPTAQRAEVLSAFRSARSRHTGNPNLAQGMRAYTRELDELLRVARPVERWRVVKGICEVLRDADPANFRHEKLEHRADLILARPVLNVRGFFEVDGEVNVFFSVRDRDTDKYSTYEVREGEEFHEVFKLLRIIGDKEACEILYKPIDDPYIVKSPSGRRDDTVYEN